jgi:hypothetical protein
MEEKSNHLDDNKDKKVITSPYSKEPWMRWVDFFLGIGTFLIFLLSIFYYLTGLTGLFLLLLFIFFTEKKRKFFPYGVVLIPLLFLFLTLILVIMAWMGIY